MSAILLVGIGGAIGSILRYLIGIIPIGGVTYFPVKTLFINVIGSFCIGLVTAFALKYQSLNPNLVLMFKVGVCGGFTTFSTFSYETVMLFNEGRGMMAIIYIIASIILSIIFIYFAFELVGVGI